MIPADGLSGKEPRKGKLGDLTKFLAEARQFAFGDYTHALAQGSHLPDVERKAVAAKLHSFTAMPESMILNANLRVTPNRFEKELLRDERRTVGRLDARFKGLDRDAAGKSPEFDAVDAAFAAASGSPMQSEPADQPGDTLETGGS